MRSGAYKGFRRAINPVGDAGWWRRGRGFAHIPFCSKISQSSPGRRDGAMGIRTMAMMLAAAALLAQPADLSAQRRRAAVARPPTVPGTCVLTRIREVTQRLEDGITHRVIPDSGSAVMLENGVYGVSYSQHEPVNNSRRGDRVYTCLMVIPTGCPPGDARGRIYTTTNLRTQESWTLPDSAHGCGGA
jgi:hypothetical protein